MITVSIILLIVAFVLLLVSAVGVTHPRVNFGWLGMATWALSIILAGVIKV